MKRAFLLFVALIAFDVLLEAQGWQELGTGSHALKANNDIVSICADSGSILYVAGGFTDSLSDTIGTCYVAKWDGATWSMLGNDTSFLNSLDETSSICIDAQHNVYIVASVRNIGDKVMKWNGATWSELGTGINALNANSSINSLCIDAFGNVYAAGNFTDSTSYTKGNPYVAKWNGTKWSMVGTGSNALNPNDEINSIIVDPSGNVYAAGGFRYIPGGYCYVAKWDGITWSELGTGSNSLNADHAIKTLHADASGNIYAGGYFEDAEWKSYVAKWDGLTWSELGTGSNSLNTKEEINSICTDAFGNVYTNQFFSKYDDSTNVSKWNGSTWSQIGIGANALNANSEIWIICADQSGNIYAAGDFSDAATDEEGLKYVAFYDNNYDAVHLISNKNEIINIYPNPADNIINVAIADDIVGMRYSISNMTGVTVYSGILATTNTKINISQLSDGIYFIQIEDYQHDIYKIIKK